MASDAGMAYWAFVEYLQRNPFKGPSGMTKDDIGAMADLFYVANATVLNQTRPAVDAALTNAYYPNKAHGGSTGIAAARTKATIDQAYYPDRPQGS
jgi:hypothetical protein